MKVVSFSVFAVALLALGMSPAVASAADDEGFVPIFDGKTLEGWDGNPAFWSVEDGAITGETTPENPTKPNTFIVWRGGNVDDFELKLEYRLRNGNSGIQYRSWEEPDNWGKWVIGGYQADIADNKVYTGILYGERYRGILAKRGEKAVIGANHKPEVVGNVGDGAALQSHIKEKDWNEFHIIAKGFHFTHIINGHVMCEVTDEDTEMRRASGLLALQLHQGPPMKIQFRNIRLKRLAMESRQSQDAKKKIVLLAGRKSHGYAGHEHKAGCLLLAKLLENNVPGVATEVFGPAWPDDPSVLENADAIVIFCDGGGGHMAMRHLDEVGPLMKKGVGLACLHYGVEIPKGDAGDLLKSWIGGYYETWWSVNPHFKAEFTEFPDHPVARGVKPFAIDDEWYYHMRFVDDMEGVTPILTTIPPDKTRERRDGAHSGNPTVRARKGMPEHVAWAYERPGGGRGFGFTGGHWHWNWANNSFRTVVLNGILWVAGVDVPQGGVPSKTPSLEELKLNQDFPEPNNYDFQRVQKMLGEWRKQ
jgi:type 1 glutamine amidotransferase